jgi:hypothetical protein
VKRFISSTRSFSRKELRGSKSASRTKLGKSIYTASPTNLPDQNKKAILENRLFKNSLTYRKDGRKIFNNSFHRKWMRAERVEESLDRMFGDDVGHGALWRGGRE